MIKMSLENITETYLSLLNDQNSENNIVSEEFHRAPILGWNKDYFAKVMVKMLKHAIEKYAADEFNNYFLSKKLFLFDKLFKEKPKINTGGNGKKFSATINYTTPIKEKESALILIGNYQEGGKLKKFLHLSEGDRRNFME